MVSKWLFIAQTVHDIGCLYQPLEDCVRHHFLPAVTGCSSPGDLERDLFALPARLEGLGIGNPTQLSSTEFLLRIRLLSLYSHLFCHSPASIPMISGTHNYF